MNFYIFFCCNYLLIHYYKSNYKISNKLTKIKFEQQPQQKLEYIKNLQSQNKKVLMLGFMNEEAWNKTSNEKKVTFFSRSKNRLWTKGETSGNFLFVKEILTDCDNDTILIKVNPAGPVCHTGNDTCFNEVNTAFSIEKLEEIINDRKNNPCGTICS